MIHIREKRSLIKLSYALDVTPKLSEELVVSILSVEDTSALWEPLANRVVEITL